MSTPQHADAARDRAALARLFEAESTLALATVDAQGAACIAPLYYVAGDALHLYWLSSPASRHSRNLRAGALAEVTVFHATSDWRAICGAQCRGMVAVVRGARRRALLAR
jgi:nitroimidazol reductase NimA-like FMN-containing flavoprotein (pyridoxamine 5'-phosphate oxidase superfamily)